MGRVFSHQLELFIALTTKHRQRPIIRFDVNCRQTFKISQKKTKHLGLTPLSDDPCLSANGGRNGGIF